MMQYITNQRAQGICPFGWHIPDDNDWCVLTTYKDPTVDCDISYGGWSGTDIGIKMKNVTGWNLGNGTNTSGFTALPSGYRYIDGSFDAIGSYTLLWSSSEAESTLSIRRDLGERNDIRRTLDFKKSGATLRCIKD
jgi:uncharacterized protein (TIGR02145 family)